MRHSHNHPPLMSDVDKHPPDPHHAYIYGYQETIMIVVTYNDIQLATFIFADSFSHIFQITMANFMHAHSMKTSM